MIHIEVLLPLSIASITRELIKIKLDYLINFKKTKKILLTEINALIKKLLFNS
jgi:hypothetical protein